MCPKLNKTANGISTKTHSDTSLSTAKTKDKEEILKAAKDETVIQQ